MSNHHSPLSYEKVTILQDTPPHRVVARFKCARCDAHQDITINGPHNPQLIVRKAVERYWKVDITTASRNRCPNCVASKRNKTTTEENIPMALGPNGAQQLVPTAPRVAALEARQLTREERTKVKALLDDHFDDATGQYLDGYTDQRVGTEANVPWKSVSEFRDFVYGPIRSDPLLAEIKKNIETAEGALRICREHTLNAERALNAANEKYRQVAQRLGMQA